MIVAPRSLRSWATVDFPLPMLPVRPTRSMYTVEREIAPPSYESWPGAASARRTLRRKNRSTGAGAFATSTRTTMSATPDRRERMDIDESIDDAEGIGQYAAMVQEQLALVGENPLREGL